MSLNLPAFRKTFVDWFLRLISRSFDGLRGIVWRMGGKRQGDMEERCGKKKSQGEEAHNFSLTLKI
jgi:hypothetical protein